MTEDILVPLKPNVNVKFVFVPASLNHLTDNDAWLIHLLFRQRIYKKRHRNEFISLKKQYLREQLGMEEAEPILQKLIKAQVIECDGKYLVGRKCYGYRLTDKYRNDIHRKKPLTDKFLIKRLSKWFARPESNLPVHQKLRENLEQIKIRAAEARTCSNENYNNTLQSIEFEYLDAAIQIGEDRDQRRIKRHRAKLRKKALTSLRCELHAIDMIANGSLWFTHDAYGRCHTNLTNLSGRVRKIMYKNDKEPLVELDIACSQPIILAATVIQWFKNNKKSFDNQIAPEEVPVYDFATDLKIFLNEVLPNTKNPPTTTTPPPPHHTLHDDETFCPSNLPLDVQWFKNNKKSFDNQIAPEEVPVYDFATDLKIFLNEVLPNTKNPPTTTTPPPPHHTLHDDETFCPSNLPLDVQWFTKLCEKGELYEQLNSTDRKTAKRMFFKMLFGRTADIALTTQFPNIAQAAQFAKEKDYRHLSHMLQRAESRIVIYGVAEALTRADIWVTTIHDSFIVEKRHQERAMQLIQEEFRRWSVQPKVKVNKLSELSQDGSRRHERQQGDSIDQGAIWMPYTANKEQ